MNQTSSLKQLASLVKTNLRSIRSIILGEEKRKKRILNILFLFVFFIASTEVSFIRMFNMLRLSNNEILIFNSIINIQLILTTFFVFIKIMNTFYLASDWKEMMVYPIKQGNLLLSKCILCYFSSILISIFVLILLFSYGILTNVGFAYYLHVTIYEIIITAVPTVFLVLILLTIFGIIVIIKESKRGHKNNKWLILIDLAVIILTYMLLKSALSNHVKIGSLLFNVFFNGNQSTETLINFIIVSSIIIVSYLGVYFIGGNVYLTIMKSTIFSSRDSKKIELQPSQYEFKLRNPIISNIIRDAKLIMRIQSLHVNCITANTIFSIIGIIVLIICRKLVISIVRIDFQGIKSFLVILWFLTFQITNGTIITSFSREGRALNQLKVFPLEGKKILLSKIFIGIITNILRFINTNVLIALISSNFTEFILLEIVLLTYMIATVIIELEIDLNSMELKWVAIKDLFLGHYLKILKPYFILTLLPVIYILVAGSYGRLLHIELTEYLNAFFIIFIGIIYSLHSFKKIIKNMT